MKQYNLLEERVQSLFLRYLIPSVSGTLVTAVYILVDTIIVGKGIGADAVAGLNIVLPLFSLFYGTGLLFGVGGSVLLAFSKGRGKEQDARGYFSVAFLCVAVLAVLYTVLFQLLFEPVTDFLGAAHSTRIYVNEYGRTIIWGTSLFMLSSFLQTFLRNDKAPKLAMAGTITGGVANIVLDIIFVFGFRWGMFGAAFATVIGNGLGVAVLLSHFWSKQNTLHFSLAGVTLKTPLRIIKNGFSSFLIEMSAGIVTFLFNIQLMKYTGVAGVTAYSIISNTAIMLTSMSNGVSQAAQPIVATNYGAGKKERVYRVRQLGLACSAGIGLLFTGTALLFPDFLINIFIRPTPDVWAIAQPAIRIYGGAFVLSAVNLFLSNYFQGTLKPGYAMAICLSRGLLLNVLFVFALPPALGVTGVWLTIPLAELLTTALAFVLLHQSKRRKAKAEKQFFPAV